MVALDPEAKQAVSRQFLARQSTIAMLLIREVLFYLLT